METDYADVGDIFYEFKERMHKLHREWAQDDFYRGNDDVIKQFADVNTMIAELEPLFDKLEDTLITENVKRFQARISKQLEDAR